MINTNIYFELVKVPTFTTEYVTKLVGNHNTARSAIARLMKDGVVERIRNSLYTCLSSRGGTTIASKYQIASAITETSCVSHHSALEYYGLTNQIYYEVYVSSERRFEDFEYGGLVYRFLPLKISMGIEEPEYSNGVRITDKERTVIDSIKDFDRIGGLEELLSALEPIQYIDEEKIIKYLIAYNNKFLSQKVGYLFEHSQNNLKLSNEFYRMCRQLAGKSKRYLSKEQKNGKLIKEWNLVVPEDMYNIQGMAGDIIVSI
ncbi:MAG: hypothetical protein KA282_02180 [Clostridia bacterium]|nr:hypothetical protein [Clostridia bacterium]